MEGSAILKGVGEEGGRLDWSDWAGGEAWWTSEYLTYSGRQKVNPSPERGGFWGTSHAAGPGSSHVVPLAATGTAPNPGPPLIAIPG